MRGGTASVGGGQGTAWRGGDRKGRVTKRVGDQRPPRPGHTGDRETDASSAHHAPEAGPTAPSHSQLSPRPARTRTHGQGHKVACLLQRGQEAHQQGGAGPWFHPASAPVADSSHGASAHPCSSAHPAARPPGLPRLDHRPHPQPSLVIRSPARRSGLGRAGGGGAGEVRAEGGRGEGRGSHHLGATYRQSSST